MSSQTRLVTRTRTEVKLCNISILLRASWYEWLETNTLEEHSAEHKFYIMYMWLHITEMPKSTDY